MSRKENRMNREQAINYLYSSGMSSEQIRTIEEAFINTAIDRIKTEIKELAAADTIDVLVEVVRIIDNHREVK